MDNLVEVDELSEKSNLANKFIDAKYMLKDSNQVKTGIEIDDKKR